MEPIILKNDKMTIELNESLAMRNVCVMDKNCGFPSYNSCKQQMGMWTHEEGFAWVDKLNWNKQDYLQEEFQSVYAHATSQRFDLSLGIEDFIHSDERLYLRKITINNGFKNRQDFKLFFQQSFFDNETVVYSLGEKNLYHENKGRYTLFNGSVDNQGIVQFSTCSSSDENLFDFENGKLTFNPISSGQVKSIFSLETSLLSYEIKNFYFWMAVGHSVEEVNLLNQRMKNEPEWLIDEFIYQKNTGLERFYIGK